MSRTGWMSAIAAMLAVLSAVFAFETEPSAASGPIDGAALFQTKGCSACHAGPDSTAPAGSQFPSLAEAASWAGDRRPNLTASGYLAESIIEPRAFFSPARTSAMEMPDLGLSEAEVGAVVDYLLTG